MNAPTHTRFYSRVFHQIARPTLGLSFLLFASQLHAQVSANGSWGSSGGGTWGGNLFQWAYTSPYRPAELSVTRKSIATANAIRNARGEVIAVNLVNGGSGFTTSPRVIITGGSTGGYGAEAVATISAGGVVNNIKLISKGGGYSGNPTVTITSELDQVTVLQAGSGYTGVPELSFTGGGGYTVPPTITMDLGSGASASVTRVGNAITAITPSNVGIGYGPNSTTVTISGGGGTGALATPVITGDVLFSASANILTDTFTVIGEAPPNNAPVEFSGSDVLPGGVSGTLPYFVVNSSGSTFQISTSVGGAVLDLNTTAGSAVVFTSTPGAKNADVTANLGTHTFTVTAGNAQPDDTPVSFSASDVVPGGIERTKTYYVVNSSGSSFRVARSLGGSPIQLNTTNGSNVVVTWTGGTGRVIGYVVTNPGSGYTSNPTVTINVTAPIVAASATSVIEDGVVTGIEILSNGEGYLDPPLVRFSPGPGEVGIVSHSATRALARIQGGAVTDISLLEPGGAGGVESTVTLNPEGDVNRIELTNSGTGFTSVPAIEFGRTRLRTALASSSRSGSSLSSFNVTNPGLGYATAPAVTIGTNGWQGYISAPRVSFISNGIRGAHATATRTGATITGVSIQDGGNDYVTAPSVSFIGGGGSGAAATAVISSGRVTAVTMTSNGTGYTSTPTVVFTAGGVTYPVVTSNFSAGRVTGFTIVQGGSGHVTAPTISIAAPPNGGPAATATAVLTSGAVSSLTLTSGGGAVPASAIAILTSFGTVASIQLRVINEVPQAGTGYTANPTVTLAAPTGFLGTLLPAPGGVGSYVYFNNNITGGATITLEAPRTVGFLTIGDPFNFNGAAADEQPFTLSPGAGGSNNSLSFAMGSIGGGKSFINKAQGNEDTISARVFTNEELNIRVNKGRLTLSGGLSGSGDYVSSGNGNLRIGGSGASSLANFWLQNRGGGGTGPQLELAARGGPAVGNVRIGSASLGSAGNAVLQLLENRFILPTFPSFDEGNQIDDMATIIADGATNRWAYFKLMGGNETIGNIIDVSNSLVLENMEGETVNRNATLTLGGNNLDSFIGGFVRNRAGGSGVGTLGITKNGTGSLTLRGGNINYTGFTVLNGGTLNLVNTPNFSSSIIAAAGTSLNVDTEGSSVTFNDSVLGAAALRKIGTGFLNFNSGETKLDSLSSFEGSVTFRSGDGTLRGEKSEITEELTLRGGPGISKFLSIGSSLSVGNLVIDGGRRDIFAISSISGQVYNSNNIGSAFDAVVESSNAFDFSSVQINLSSIGNTIDRTVQRNANGVTVELNDVSNLVVGSIITFSNIVNNNPTTGVTILEDTRLLAVNQTSKTITLSKSVIIPSGRIISINYSSATDGAIRGESLNFTDVVHNGRQFIAVTSKGTIHTSLDGQLWDKRYTDPAGVSFNSVVWTGEVIVVAGDLGRLLSSEDGLNWTIQSTGGAVGIKGATSTNLSFTGNSTVGSPILQSVTSASSYAIGTPIFGMVTPPFSLLQSVNVSGASLVIDSNALVAASEVDFGYFRGTTSVSANQSTITNVRTAQNLPTGTPISSGNLIPVGASISAVNGPGSTLTLSQAATASAIAGTSVPLFTLTGNLTANSTTVQNLSNRHGLAVGMTIVGLGIPKGAYITEIDTVLNRLSLSEASTVTSSGTPTPLSIYMGTLAPNSTLVQNVTSLGSFRPQMVVQGLLFPRGTRVSATGPTSLTLSNSALATVTAANLSQRRTERLVSGVFTQDTSLVTGVTDFASLALGMSVHLPGVTQPGTVISLISGSNVTLSKNALQTVPLTQFRAGYNLVVVGDNGYIATSLDGMTGSWLTRSAGVTLNLASVAASPTHLVAVGSSGITLRSVDGSIWTNQTPPIVPSGASVLNVSGTNISISSVAQGTRSGVSFGSFKGNTSGTNVIENVTAMPSLRVGIPVSAESGIPAGTRISQVQSTGFTMTTPATITEANKQIRTFSAITTTGSRFLTEVSDFKGLSVGMALHGSAFNSTETATIIELRPESEEIRLSRVPTFFGRGTFGVLYGNLAVGSTQVSNVTNLPSLQRFPGTSHFSAGKQVAAVPGTIPGNVTVSGYNPGTNQLTLSANALSSADNVPLLTLTGSTTNNSSTISDVKDFSELFEGMVILVTGDALGNSVALPFTIFRLDDAGDQVILETAPNMNLGSDPVSVSLAIYSGSTVSGSSIVRNVKNIRSLPLTLPTLRNVVWTGSQFVTVGDYGAIFTSPDGSAWTSQNSNTGLDLTAVAVAGSQILVAGQDGLILSSANGTTWAEQRRADSAALNDVRAVDQIKAVISANGKTLALGSGGLSINNGGVWGTSLNDTFSGTQLDIGVAGNMRIRNEVGYNNRLSRLTETNQNNANRIDDAATLNSKGGRFSFSNNAADGIDFSETIGKLRLTEGQLTISTTSAGTGGRSTLTFGSLQSLPGAALNFATLNRDESGDDSGLLGTNVRNRVFFTQNPTLDDGIMGGQYTVGNEWATYNATNGVSRLDPTNGYQAGDVGSWLSTQNVKMSTGRTLTAARTVNSLNLVSGTLNLAAFRLSIASGGLLVAGTGSQTINSTTGALTVGSPLNTPSTLYVHYNNGNQDQTLTINAPIQDFLSRVTITTALALGATQVTLPSAAALDGLQEGMGVSGNGIAPGTRIESINIGANRITLTLPTTLAIPTLTELTFRGGSVSLSKNGAGILALNSTNSYTGKTFINAGTVRINSLSNLGASPTQFVKDQIQLNGGSLQIGHPTQNNSISPDININLSDGLRGVSIGAAGGRIEVGSANPQNTNFVPIINFTITNPIETNGLLEVAIRSNQAQKNSLTLGNQSSSNTFLSGIQTDVSAGSGNYNGILNILGDNTIGGINQQGGDVFITGDNNFTAPIRSTQGDLTIEGNNTWRGGNYFDQAVTIQSGVLTLKSPGALGTGGLNLRLGAGGSAGVLRLAGVSQTIRQISDSTGSSIDNVGASPSLASDTDLIFDLNTNQTLNGRILNGPDKGIRLIKRGPAELILRNSGSEFSGGVVIEQGGLNVTTIGDVFAGESSLGADGIGDPSSLVIDKSTLSFSLTSRQSTNRSFTMGAGPQGASLVANASNQEARLIFGRENRNIFVENADDISSPIAFKDSGSRTLTLGGTGRGDNTLLLELRDKSINEVSALLKLGSGTWVLGKAAPYSGLTNINEGILTVTANNALGTDAEETTVDPDTDRFTGQYPNGTQVTFPLFLDTVLPGGLTKDTAYYVVNSTLTNFQIAATPGGGALPIGSAGSNVRFVPKVDSFRSTSLNIVTDTFSGNLTNGQRVTFSGQIVAGLSPQLPAGLQENTYYYVINASNGSFQVSLTPEPSAVAVDFTTEGTRGALYYSTLKVGNPSGGVNLTAGTLLLSNVNYLTPETLNLEGGTLAVPADSHSTWTGNIRVNTVSTINVGQGGSLSLSGNIIGTNMIIQEGEGRLILQGETIMPLSNTQNFARDFAVRAGSLVLDYSLNNGSKLVDNAWLRLGGSRRGGEVILAGGDHEEIVGLTILESGVSKIYRESGTSTIRLNSIVRTLGSSLYVDSGRLVKTDQPNSNGILGAWAITRDALTNAFWMIPGTSSYAYSATASATTSRVTTRDQNGDPLPHTLANGTLVRFTTTGTMPGGLSANTNYYVFDTSGTSDNSETPERIGTFRVASSPGNSVIPITLTSSGTGNLSLTTQLAFTVNPQSDTLTSTGDHRLARGGVVRVASYGTLPAGLLAGTDYYLIDVTNRTFRLSLTLDGRPINITNTGAGVHTVESQGAVKRVGSASLVFTADASRFPASEGNGKIKVSISPQLGLGDITATLTGDGTLISPYVYTIFTTEEKNTNNDVVAFVANDTQRAGIFSVATSGGNDIVNSVKDLGAYGEPTFLAGGTFDNGNNELDWARNEGSGGSSLNDGFIMPNGEYVSSWSSLSNTAVTQNLTISTLTGRDTYSVRFASQNASTINLANNAINSVRSGGILISPTVGANDTAINGTGSISTGGEGNLQNLVVHQYNDLGSFNIGAKVTDRAVFQRVGVLTGSVRNQLIMDDLSGIVVGQLVGGSGIPGNTRVAAIDVPSRTLTLSQNHDGFVSNSSVAYSFGYVLAGLVNNTLTNYEIQMISVSGISVGNLVSGTGIPAGSLVSAIDANTNVVTLNLEHDGIVRLPSVNYTFLAPLETTIAGEANSTNTLELVMTSVQGLSNGLVVKGAGISPGTLITAINPATDRVTISLPHDGIIRPNPVDYTFVSSSRPGVASDPNRRILVGVANAKNLAPNMTVTGPGIVRPGTKIISVDKARLIVTLDWDHDGNYRRGDFVFSGIQSRATTGDSSRNRIVGLVKPGNGIPGNANEAGTLGTSDVYPGLPISGPGIPFGAFVSGVGLEGDLTINTNHFFTGEISTVSFTPTTGLEKLGSGTLALTGDNQYTGVTYIGEGVLRVQKLTDAGVAGSLGLSTSASSNLFFNGGELLYIGESAKTNRGFQLAESAVLNIGHEKTEATFTGAISGIDRIIKEGSGTLVLNGNANLESFRVEQGRLLLQTVDTNPSPGTYSPTNFAQSNLTSLRLAGGILELRGTPEGNVTQTFGSTFFVEEGASQIKVTSVEGFDPNNLAALTSFRSTTLNLMGQEEATKVSRSPGGTLHFVLNAETTSAPAKIILNTTERGDILPWATFQDLGANQFGGVNDFAFVESSTGEIISGNNFLSTQTATSDWAESVSETFARDHVSEVGTRGFTGTITGNRVVNTLRYESSVDSTITINAGGTLEVVSGAILVAFDVNGSQKKILGSGKITGGSFNTINSDFFVHNYNPASTLTIGAGIVDRVKQANGSTAGLGSVIAGESVLKLSSLESIQLFLSLRPGSTVSGSGLATGTKVTNIDVDNRLIFLSQPAVSGASGQSYQFAETLNLVQTGIGTTILAGNNTYSGKTFVHGGVLRLDSANAVPGGIGSVGGTSALVLEGGIVGLGAGDFSRALGQGADKVQFKGNGGFAAYGADRSVNLGGAATPDRLRFGNTDFIPDGSSLLLGSHDATHKVIFQNPIDLGSFSQVIRVANGPADIEAELAGDLSGLGRLIKFGLGTLRMAATSTHSGGIEIAEGRLVAANITNVFGAAGSTTGAVRLGTSRTNTSKDSGIELVLEGGTVNNRLEVGAVNAATTAWIAGGQVDTNRGSADVGSQSKMVMVDGAPSIAYYDATNKDLKYVHAADARGTSWLAPVTVVSRGDVGKSPSLQVINGNPAITYYDESNKSLMYVRANDVPGALWGNPVPLLAANVLAVAVQPADGKILVAGSFTRFYGQDSKRRIVRLNADGSLDNTFNAFIQNGEIRDILVQADGKIIIGGTFTSIRNASNTNDVTRSRLARLNGTGVLDESFVQNLNGDVRVIVQMQDQKFLVGGGFTSVNGVNRTRLARFESDGRLDGTFDSPDIRNGEVRAIAFHNVAVANQVATGAYVIGGNFTSVGGTDNQNRLARINLTGGRDLSFNPNVNSDVNAVVALADNKLLIGGAFGAVANGVESRTRLARLNANGTLDRAFAQEVNGTVNRLVLERSGSVLVTGNFSILGDFQRSFIGRILSDGSIDSTFNPDANFEVRDLVVQEEASLLNDKIVLGGLFTGLGGSAQTSVARINLGGQKDASLNFIPLDTGSYSSLLAVNGNPAVAYYEAINQNLEYVRATDLNGSSWPNPQLIDDSGNVGVGISMIIGNIGGDILVKDTLGTPTDTSDDEVTISANSAGVENPALIGTPIIAYGDATNSKVKYVVANNATGDVNTAPVTNWSEPASLPITENVGADFSLLLVDKFPAIAYVGKDSKNLSFMRAKNESGLLYNLRDVVTKAIVKIKVSELVFTLLNQDPIAQNNAWEMPELLDGSKLLDMATVAGVSPCLAMVNGVPTTDKPRPAVSYYDQLNGNLKLIVASNSTGSEWPQPSLVIAASGDVGLSSTLMMTEGSQAISYHDKTAQDLRFIIRNEASGYSRISFMGNTTWSGSVDLKGTATFAPSAGQTATISGAVTGLSGFRLAGEGILNLTNAANAFGTSLIEPNVTAPSGAAVNGGVIIRSGSLLFGGTTGISGQTALGNSTVELGDAVPNVLSAHRATNGNSILLNGGSFSTNHNGSSATIGGPGVFVRVGPTVDGKFYGLTASTATASDDRFTGSLSDGTRIRFVGQSPPGGISFDSTYYVRNAASGKFQVSAEPTGPITDLTTAGERLFFIEETSLEAVILVKDETTHPERNGLYRFVVDGSSSSLSATEINLMRIEGFDSPSEMLYGVKVNVLEGNSAGKPYFLLGNVVDVNISAVNWMSEAPNSNKALLATVAGLNVNNAIDVNASVGTAAIGAVNTVTSGIVTYRGPITMQSLASTREMQEVSLTSFISSGPGVVIEGLISEAVGGSGANTDRLILIKDGPGVVTLKANNTFNGGVVINAGTLLVMNTPSGASDSGTGSGTVAVNANGVLGGIGSIAGNVNLFGTADNAAILRPGDPNSSSAAVETLTIKGAITVGAFSVLEFKVGVDNFTKLAGSTIDLANSTSRIVVTADPGYAPTVGTEIDLLDFNAGGFTVFGGLNNLANLLTLPAAIFWDTSQFLTTGKIIAAGDAEPVVITTHPLPLDQTIQQGSNVSYTVEHGGTGPFGYQWLRDGSVIPGATNKTLNISSAAQADEGSYSVRVFNPLNPAPVGVLSNAASLTVDWPVSFAQNLSPTAIASLGYTATLRVLMNGEGGPFTYQWKKGAVNVGTNSNILTLTNVTVDTAGTYTVTVTGPSLSTKPVNVVESIACVLTTQEGAGVDPPPSPAPLQSGADLQLTATVSENATAIQWFHNGAAVPGGTSATLTLCGVTVANSGDYTVRVTSIGSLGKPVFVTSSPPTSVIITDNQPKTISAQLAKSVTMTASVGSTRTVKVIGYDWQKNGVSLSEGGRYKGVKTRTLRISGLVLDDSDTYSCRITVPSGTTTAGTTYLRVYDSAPELVLPMNPPKGMVGGFYSWQIPVSSAVPIPSSGPNPPQWRSTPATYSVTGLPKGLRVDAKTGIISGYPQVSTPLVTKGFETPTLVPFTITITVSNAVRPGVGVTTNRATALLDIKPMPSGIAGTYVGPIARHSSNGNLGGRFGMTITPTGAISGTVTFGSTAARRFTLSGLDMNLDGAGNLIGLIGAKITVAASRPANAAAMDLQFALQTTAPVAPAVAPSTLIVNATAKPCGAASGAVITGWRNKWAAKAVPGVSDVPSAYVGSARIPAVPAKPEVPATPTSPAIPAVAAKPEVPATNGPYNFLIALPENDPLLATSFDPYIPRGSSYASFTVSSAGTCIIAGRTADNMSLSSACAVGPTGQLFVFQQLPYTKTIIGSLLGNLQIELGTASFRPINNDVSGTFSWVRPPNPAVATAKSNRLYRSGFGSPQSALLDSGNTITSPVQLVAFGGLYIAPPISGVAPLKVIMGLDPVLNPTSSSAVPNARLIFSQSGNGTSPVTGARNPNIDVLIAAASKSTTPIFREPTPTNTAANPNPANTKVTPRASNGSFAGTFTLIDPSTTTTPLRRPVAFQGLIIRERTSELNASPRVTRTYGQGYFILNDLPPSGQPATTVTPQRSGVVEFTKR